MNNKEAMMTLKSLKNKCVAEQLRGDESVYNTQQYVEAINISIKMLQDKKTGKWIQRTVFDGFKEQTEYQCSICDFYWKYGEVKHCPNCGNRMTS